MSSHIHREKRRQTKGRQRQRQEKETPEGSNKKKKKEQQDALLSLHKDEETWGQRKETLKRATGIQKETAKISALTSCS